MQGFDPAKFISGNVARVLVLAFAVDFDLAVDVDFALDFGF